jgi:hypothetical protein
MGEATREGPGSGGALPYLAGLSVILPCDVTPMNSFVDCSTNLYGGDAMGGATREAPVRAEPHPTSPNQCC